jgi:HEPN domain-containing protein/predicted nucleotidyltransferase
VLSTAVLPEEWRRLVIERLAPFDPEKIIVFGSRARGEARATSDLDLLVVLESVAGDGDVQVAMRDALHGLPVAFDVFAISREDLDRTADAVGSFVYPVVREGTVIYGVDDRDAGTWLRYAEEDLTAAQRMVEGRGWAPRIACFHAQQAAEKAFKAVLVAQGIPLQHTHNLELLRDLVPSRLRASRIEDGLERMSDWAVVTRYPGAQPDAGRGDAEEALAKASEIVEAARADVRS